MLFMFQNKDKDLLGSYQYGCDPFCVSLLTDRHLKVRSNSILLTFSDKGAFTSARGLVASRVARKKSQFMTLYVTSPNLNVLIVIINFLLAKNHRENILQRTIHGHTYDDCRLFDFTFISFVQCKDLHYNNNNNNNRFTQAHNSLTVNVIM